MPFNCLSRNHVDLARPPAHVDSATTIGRRHPFVQKCVRRTMLSCHIYPFFVQVAAVQAGNTEAKVSALADKEQLLKNNMTTDQVCTLPWGLGWCWGWC